MLQPQPVCNLLLPIFSLLLMKACGAASTTCTLTSSQWRRPSQACKVICYCCMPCSRPHPTVSSGKIKIGGFSLEVGAPASANGRTTQPIALTTVEHCMSAQQTITVMASFEINEDGLLCPCDHNAFIYKGTVKSAQKHLQQATDAKRTWQYICAVSRPPLAPYSIILLTLADRLRLLPLSQSRAIKLARAAAGFEQRVKC